MKMSLQIFLILSKKCRSLVCTLKHSNLLSEQLKKAMECRRNNAQEMQKNNSSSELPPIRKLKQDVPTRWNSTYLMLKSVFDAHDCVKEVVNNNVESKRKYGQHLRNNLELSVVEDLLDLLMPFFELTELMSGVKYVTASIIQPAINRLLGILQIYRSK